MRRTGDSKTSERKVITIDRSERGDIAVIIVNDNYYRKVAREIIN